MAKSALGRGLSALLPDDDSGREGKTGAKGDPAGRDGEVLVKIEKLRPNPGQPRRRFDKAELEELAASIKQHGVIQPVIAEKSEHGGYTIIAGERRCRAAALAGFTEVPVLLRSYSSQKRLEVALIENLHRADLNPVEEATAYKQLMDTAGLSQEEAAERVGKNRSTVANALRLLKLPPTIKEALEEGKITAGHARAILSLPRGADQERLFSEISGKSLSVRAAEKLAAGLAAGAKGGKKGPAKRDPEIKAMEEKFIRALGTKVTINGGLKRGRIDIEYYSMDDLERLFGLFESLV